MFGPKYVWIIPGDYQERWWENGTSDDPDYPGVVCKSRDLVQALDGHFGTDVLTLSTNGEVTVSGLVSFTTVFDLHMVKIKQDITAI